MDSKLLSPDFEMIVSNLLGSEGPVFDAAGTSFYMVAPEVEVDGKPAGNIMKVDIESKKVLFHSAL